jgi:hypothetical protein
VSELYFLFNAEHPDVNTCNKMENTLKKFSSRLSFILSYYGSNRQKRSPWADAQVNYALLWRIYITILCKIPTPEELNFWKNSDFSIDEIIKFLMYFNHDLNNSYISHYISSSIITRKDVIIMYTLLLLHVPESEMAIITSMLLPSLDILAKQLYYSEEGIQMREYSKFARSKPLSEKQLSDFDLEYIKTKFPVWIGGNIMQYSDKPVYEFWKHEVVHYIFPKNHTSIMPKNVNIPENVSVLWFGTGSMTKCILPAIDRTRLQINAFIDEREEVQGSMFMDAPVIGLDEVRQYDYDYIIVSARPGKLIKNKLQKINIQDNKVLSLDFEEGLFEVAAMYKRFDQCLDIFLYSNPMLSNILSLEKLHKNSWIRQIRARWEKYYI